MEGYDFPDGKCWARRGWKLNLHPIILPNGLIRVRVRPQITSVDFGNATLRKGRYVPALVTRQIDATYDSCHTAA
jgi:Flp pilus assembly secretin CpaC